MAELIHSSSLKRRERLDVAQKRIAAFRKRFGEVHLLLAQHAAFPLAFTPDLLYRLWANFQRDVQGKKLNIPWIAVADLLLSPLCNEVGEELYEMDVTIRNELLKVLQTHPDFGQPRIEELSNFLLDYIQQQLHSNDPDIREFARVQRWTALAYTQPTKTAHELAKAMSELDQSDTVEKIRIASLIETFAEPLGGFAPLVAYARGVGHLARGDVEEARMHFSAVRAIEKVESALNVGLPMPEVDNFHTWRELLGSIIQDAHEKQRIAQAIGVTPMTLLRWANNTSTPRSKHLRPLIAAIPSHYRSSMLDLLQREFPDFSFAIQAIQDSRLEELQVENEYEEINKKLIKPNQQLRSARLNRGWTQKEVAQRIGLTDAHTVSRWERGVTLPIPYYVRELCNLFQCGPQELDLLPPTQPIVAVASPSPMPEQITLPVTRRKKTQADVLIVTVTSVETEAVLAHVPKKSRVGIRNRAYHDLDMIGDARTFLVQLPAMGSGGSGGSLKTIEAAIQALSPWAVIMVGIAFSMDPANQRIGDILISQQIQDYDIERVGSDSGKYHLRGVRVNASALLLSNFITNRYYVFEDWPDPPAVYPGLILSGSKVFDNENFRDQLRMAAPNAVGGEMEGMGLYEAASNKHVEWLLVKAISDWADGSIHGSKKEYQQLAAENAARFTVKVIELGDFTRPSRLKRS